jgi:hypothetical protein
MLIFIQKAGAGLFYHNLFHTNNATQSPADHEKGTVYSCTCIDDFLVPFEESAQPALVTPVTHCIILSDPFKENIPFYSSTLSSLRGPPAASL